MHWHPIKNKLSHLVQWLISLHPERTAERAVTIAQAPFAEKRIKNDFKHQRQSLVDYEPPKVHHTL